MSDLFLGIVSLSLSASWLVAAVMGFRFLLKKAPKAMHVALWGLVALRLILPVSFESVLSLVPEAVGNGAVVESWTQTPVASQSSVAQEEQPVIEYGITSIPQAPAAPQFTLPPEYTNPEGTAPSPTLGNTLVPALSSIWVLGMCVMALYAIGSYGTLRWQVRTGVRLNGNIYQSEFAPTAFVLGLLRPRIYVPYGMSETDLCHVVAHERAHIARRDHWWKPLGYLLLTLHWFNPLMWIAYTLLCRDIELACDERVIRNLKGDQRADYSQTLLTCSIHQKMILACPVAFGQAGVKERVRNVLNYRKPGLWISLATAAAMIISMVCFFAVPPAQAEEPDVTPTVQFPNTPTASRNPGEPNMGSSITATTSYGLEYTLAAINVTPVGMRLSVTIRDSAVFRIKDYYWIERQTEKGWEALESQTEDPCLMTSDVHSSGMYFNGHAWPYTWPVDWSGTYGVLEPGTYRLCTIIFPEDGVSQIEFVIGDPGDSAEAQALLRYYDALDALLMQDSYHIKYTIGSIADPAVNVDADVYDDNYTDSYEIMRAGSDYLLQEYTYTTNMLNDGFMIRDGVEYRMENEIHGHANTPAIGWYQAPAADTDNFTFWTVHSIWNMDQIVSAEIEGNTVTLSVKDCGYGESAGKVLSDIVTITFDDNGGLKQIVQTTQFGPNDWREEARTSIITLTVMDSDADAIDRLIDLQDVDFYREFTWNEGPAEDETVVDRAFVNAETVTLDTVNQVIDHALNECSVTYTNIAVYFDAEALVWKVDFLVGYGKAYTESVYLNADGTTALITERSPLDI